MAKQKQEPQLIVLDAAEKAAMAAGAQVHAKSCERDTEKCCYSLELLFNLPSSKTR